METKSISVPSTWNEVTLNQFEQLLEASHNEDLTLAEREVKIMSILTGLKKDEVLSLDAPSFQSISNTLNFLNNKPEKVAAKSELTLNGVKYHADLYPKNFTAAQFLDYKILAGEDIDKKTARLLACFIYPEGATYNDGSYEPEDVVVAINEYLSVPEVTAYTDFFVLQYKVYASSLAAYSVKKIKKAKNIDPETKKKLVNSLEKEKNIIKNFGV